MTVLLTNFEWVVSLGEVFSYCFIFSLYLPKVVFWLDCFSYKTQDSGWMYIVSLLQLTFNISLYMTVCV